MELVMDPRKWINLTYLILDNHECGVELKPEHPYEYMFQGYAIITHEEISLFVKNPGLCSEEGRAEEELMDEHISELVEKIKTPHILNTIKYAQGKKQLDFGDLGKAKGMKKRFSIMVGTSHEWLKDMMIFSSQYKLEKTIADGVFGNEAYFKYFPNHHI